MHNCGRDITALFRRVHGDSEETLKRLRQYYRIGRVVDAAESNEIVPAGALRLGEYIYNFGKGDGGPLCEAERRLLDSLVNERLDEAKEQIREEMGQESEKRGVGEEADIETQDPREAGDSGIGDDDVSLDWDRLPFGLNCMDCLHRDDERAVKLARRTDLITAKATTPIPLITESDASDFTGRFYEDAKWYKEGLVRFNGDVYNVTGEFLPAVD
jgi:hypothetical protein